MIKKHLKSLPFLFPLVFLFPVSTQAHSLSSTGLASGIAHPFLGLDHLLAMVAVGVMAAGWNRQGAWKIPASFLVFMAVGALLGISGVSLPSVETGIALSVLVLGILITLSQKLSMSWTMAVVAFFAVFHGHAHGTEMPQMAQPVIYALGFFLSTALLHITGASLGYFAQRANFASHMLRYAGVGMAFIGMSSLV